jgi:hypothetical protein
MYPSSNRLSRLQILSPATQQFYRRLNKIQYLTKPSISNRSAVLDFSRAQANLEEFEFFGAVAAELEVAVDDLERVGDSAPGELEFGEFGEVREALTAIDLFVAREGERLDQ